MYYKITKQTQRYPEIPTHGFCTGITHRQALKLFVGYTHLIAVQVKHGGIRADFKVEGKSIQYFNLKDNPDTDQTKDDEIIVAGTLPICKRDYNLLPEGLYHCTYQQNLPSIQQNGLGSTSDYHHGIYKNTGFFLTRDIESAYCFSRYEKQLNNPVVCLVIPKTELLPENLYYDTEYDQSLWEAGLSRPDLIRRTPESKLSVLDLPISYYHEGVYTGPFTTMTF